MQIQRSELLSAEDLNAWGDVVRRFAQREVAPRCAQSEHPMGPATMRALLNQLQDLGVINSSAEAAGGLWDEDQDPSQRALAILVLQALGQVNTALAWQVHLQALAGGLERQAGCSSGASAQVLLHGSLGLGREGAVAAWVQTPMSSEQQAVMADNWGWPTVDRPRYLHALTDWDVIWMPIWAYAQGWQWVRLLREEVCVEELAYSHGLDELRTQAISVRTKDMERLTTLSPQKSHRIQGDHAHHLWGRVQAMHAVGLLVMTQATVKGAWQRANEFAHLRKQGGQVIAGHAAVQQLLSTARGATDSTQRALDAISRSGSHWPDLRARWRDRLCHQPALSQGATAALQVFGGMGYMQDNAMEKILRDVNTLRQLGGSPAELQSLLGYWDTWLDDCQQTETVGDAA